MAISVPSTSNAVSVIPDSEAGGKPVATAGGPLFGKLLSALIASSTTPATTPYESPPLVLLPVVPEATPDSSDSVLIAGGVLLPVNTPPPTEPPRPAAVSTTRENSIQEVAEPPPTLHSQSELKLEAKSTTTITSASAQPSVSAKPLERIESSITPTPVLVKAVITQPAAVDLPAVPEPYTAPRSSGAPTVSSKVPLQVPIVAEFQPREANTPESAAEGVVAAGSVAAASSATVSLRLMQLIAKTELYPISPREVPPGIETSEFQAMAARVSANGFESVPRLSASETVDAPPQVRDSQPVSLADQITDRILPRIRSSPEGSHEVRIQLNPVSLGEVKVHLAVADGGVQGTILASSEAARAAIEQSLPELRQRLEALGVSVGPMDVSTQAGSGFGDAKRFVPPAFEESSEPVAMLRRHVPRGRSSPLAGHRIDVTV